MGDKDLIDRHQIASCFRQSGSSPLCRSRRNPHLNISGYISSVYQAKITVDLEDESISPRSEVNPPWPL